MLSKERVEEIRKELASITAHSADDLISREEWGTEITFEKALPDIDLVISIARDLSDLPLEYLTEGVATQLIERIPSAGQWLTEIDQFSITGGGDPENSRDGLCSELHQETERLQDVAGPQIPYLAYRRGDVTERISRLESTLERARRIYNDAQEWVAGKREEIEDTARAAREAAASAGVATFTAEFDDEASRLSSRSKLWLRAAAGFGAATIVAAILSFFWPPVPSEAGAWETIRNVFSKVTVIAILFTSTLWCGRIYRALAHQATVNRHRALSLRTFQAFVKAAEDDYVRDGVLMAATKAVFGTVPTGLVDQSVAEEPSVNIVELGKSASKGLGSGE